MNIRKIPGHIVESLVFIVGLTVIIFAISSCLAACHINNPFVSIENPAANMKFNSMVFFFLTGVSLLLPTRFKNTIGAILQGSIFIMVVYILLHYIFDSVNSSGVLFDYFGQQINPPLGRVSYLTLVSFLLTSFSYFILFRYKHKFILTYMAFLCSIVIVLVAILSICSYSNFVLSFYLWSGLTTMVLQTAVGILLLGLVLMFKILYRVRHIDLSRELLSSLGVFIIGIVFVAVQWEIMIDRSKHYVESLIIRNAQVITLNIDNTFKLKDAALTRFFLRINHQDHDFSELWKYDAQNYFRDNQDLIYLGVKLNNGTYLEQYRNQNSNNQSIKQEINKLNMDVDINKIIHVNGNSYLLLTYPGKYGDGVAVIDFNKLLNELLLGDPEYSLLNIEILTEHYLIFSKIVPDAFTSNASVINLTIPMQFSGQDFYIRSWPSIRYLQEVSSSLPLIFLFLWLLIFMMASVMIILISKVNISNSILRQKVLKRTNLLSNAKKEYEALYEDSPELNLTISDDYKILQCNETLINRIGLTRKEEVLNTSFANLLVDSASLGRLKNALGMLTHGFVVYSEELMLRQRNGAIIHVNAAFKKHTIENNKFTNMFFVSMHDVTREKELEAELSKQLASQTMFRQDEQLYHTVLNSVTDGWWDWRIDSTELYYSDHLKELLGYLGHPSIEGYDNWRFWQFVIHPEDRVAYSRAMKNHIEQGTLFSETVRLKHRLGHFIWVVLRGCAIVDNDGVKRRMVGTLTNVTDNQVLMQEIIKISNVQQALLDGTEDLILSTDLNGVIRSFNYGAEKMLGYSAEEVIGKSTPVVFHEMAEVTQMAEKLSTEFDTVIDAGFEVFIYKSKHGLHDVNQWTYVCKNGEHKQIYLAVTALRNEKNEIYGYLGVGRDITSLVEQTAALQRSQELMIQTGDVGLIGGWNLENATGKVEWTSGMYTIFEVPQGLELDYNTQLDKFGVNGSGEYLAKTLAESAVTGIPYEIDFEVVTYNGNHKWVHSKGIPIIENGVCVRMYGVLQDITDRVKMMNELTRKETLLEQTGEIGIIGGWEHDLIAQRITWTNIMYEILETTSDEYDCNNFFHDVKTIFTARSVELFNTTVTQMREDKQPFEMEVEAVSFKGNKKWLLIRGIPLLENGKIVRLLGVWQDITAQVELKELLEAKRLRLLNVIECSELGTWEWNVQTGSVVFNDRWVEMIGYSMDELEPLNVDVWFRLIHPDDVDKCKEMLQRHFNDGEEYNLETRLLHKNGSWIWVLSRGRVMSRTSAGEPLLMEGTQLDITQFKQLQIELQQTAAKFKNLFDLAPVGIAMNEFSTGKYLDANYSLLNSIGYTLEELQALDYWDVTPAKYEDQEYIQIESMKTTRYYGPYRKEYIKKDGSAYPVLLNGILTKDEQGRDIIWSVIMDISHQVAYEEQLIQARQVAEDASIAKSQFVANMSHEIRTPMNAVIGLSQLLRDTRLNQVQGAYVDKIINSSKLLLGIINDILDYSKMESGKLELESNLFDLDILLMQLTTIFLANNRSADNLELFFNIDKDVPYLLVGDQLRLTQVLTNLISNAVKFTSAGKVILIIQKRASTDSSVSLYFAVKDTGIGISPELQTRLFKPFSQSDSSITRKYGGTGLGLTISNQILLAMGSHIDLHSEIGVGSVFSFEVKLGYETDNNKLPRDIKPKSSVLVVDDEPITRYVIRNILERDGFIVEEAGSAEDALDLVIKDQRVFDYILMDWKLPGKNGLQAIRELRDVLNNSSSTHIPSVLLISAYTKDEIQLHPDEHIPFLTKPITRTDLLSALSRNGAKLVSKDFAKLNAPKVSLTDKQILLVEDNLINQEVAYAMLERVGAKIVIANNGLEAVNIVKSGKFKFDLILMDLQMPIMSGYEAASLINAMKLDIPIIALTATVMREEIDKILASGMVAHIAKPIEREKMFATIMNCLHIDTADNEVATKKENDDLQDAVIDWGHLDSVISDNQLAIKLLKQLNNELDEHMGQLYDNIDNSETNDAQRIVHLLKGITGNLGVMKLYKILTDVDGSLKCGVKLSQTQYDAILNLVKEFKTALAQITQDEDIASSYSGNLAQCLQKIKAQVEQNEIIEDDLISYFMKNYNSVIEEEQAQKLNELLMNFEYADAINLIDELLKKIIIEE